VRWACQRSATEPQTVEEVLVNRIYLGEIRFLASPGQRRPPGVHRPVELLLIVDAADNAAMIENEVGTRAFVADLLREDLSANVRLLMLCRTVQVQLLQPPEGCHLVDRGLP
jgi:hypothetical protein